jgi:GT2 family glycosyltransferase
MSTISWVILTFNRREIVTKAISRCMQNAGAAWDELIWVDNGSTDGMEKSLFDFEPTVSVLNAKNQGVARGYNVGMGLATKDYIVLTGCDMLMPDGWLKLMKSYVEEIPHTGVASIYSKTLDQARERIQGGARVVNGLPLVPALPIERRIFKRSLLAEFGYFPETFGLYGYDDLAWAARANKVAEEKGLLNYVIPNVMAEHLGTEGIEVHDGKDDATYHAFKKDQVSSPDKTLELNRLRTLGWPKFSPFL